MKPLSLSRPDAGSYPDDAMSRRLALAELKERWTLLGLTLPGFALVLLVLAVPLAWLGWMSFLDDGGAFTLANYVRLLKPVYTNSLLTTFQIAFCVTLACVLLGYPLAYLLSQVPERTGQVLMALVLLPFWTSVLVRTYAWLVLLQRQGIINNTMLDLGLIDQPLSLVNNFFGTTVGMVHVMLPFLVLPLYDKMKNIDPQLMSAAANCGASPAQAFRQVFLRLSLPGLASGVTLVFVLSLGFYLTPALLGGGKVAMWSMKISDTISLFGNWGAASALGVTLLIVTLLMLWGLRRVFGIKGGY
ncbi:ABC transporter permease [Pseudomonas fulva]|uniref:ABC transporter permease n=1 Tax=Pseudomonas fulva TaxID=47880 RepID=UPI003CFBAAAF